MVGGEEEVSGLREDFERVYEGKSGDGFSAKEFLIMVELSNFFDDPKSPKFFKSKNHIARVFRGTPNPDDMTKNVISKMVDRRFIRIANNNELEFDEPVFDAWFEDSFFGGVSWCYFSRHSTVIRIK